MLFSGTYLVAILFPVINYARFQAVIFVNKDGSLCRNEWSQLVKEKPIARPWIDRLFSAYHSPHSVTIIGNYTLSGTNIDYSNEPKKWFLFRNAPQAYFENFQQKGNIALKIVARLEAESAKSLFFFSSLFSIAVNLSLCSFRIFRLRNSFCKLTTISPRKVKYSNRFFTEEVRHFLLGYLELHRDVPKLSSWNAILIFTIKIRFSRPKPWVQTFARVRQGNLFNAQTNLMDKLAWVSVQSNENISAKEISKFPFPSEVGLAFLFCSFFPDFFSWCLLLRHSKTAALVVQIYI